MVYTDGDMKHRVDTHLQPDKEKQLMTTDKKTEAEKSPQKPFQPQRVDLTPDEPVNIGYVGGVQLPRKKFKAGN